MTCFSNQSKKYSTKGWRLTIPLLLTCMRFLLTPCIAHALLYDYWLIGLILFSFSALTDVLDGFIARRYHQVTQLGAYLDPLADKVLIVSLFMILSFKNRIIPLWLVFFILVKELLLIISALVIFLVDKRVVVQPTVWGKAAMGAQVGALVWFVIASWAGYRLPLINLLVIMIILIAVSVSLVHYMYYGFFSLKTLYKRK